MSHVHGRVLFLVVLAVLVMVFVGPALFGQTGQEHHGQMQQMQGAGEAGGPSKCPMCRMGMTQMEFMARLKQLMADAREAADAKGDEKASAKISEAQQLLEQHHQMMHEEMKGHIQKMHGPEGSMGKEGAGASDMKCPMCAEMMGAGDGKVVNARCPIMGTKIDPEKIPENLTRTFQGKKVGFCCAACPAAWDKLSDAEKETKLQAVLGK